MAKKSSVPKITYKGIKGDGNVLKAKIAQTIMGTKISFPHRHLAFIDTGVEASAPEGYTLMFSLDKRLSAKGMVACNAPRLDNGKIVVTIINCGREIVEIRDGDPLIDIWLAEKVEFDWEKSE